MDRARRYAPSPRYSSRQRSTNSYNSDISATNERVDPFSPPSKTPAKDIPEAPAADATPPKLPYESIVIIDVDEGTGSGFLMEMKGRKFLITNVHVIAGASKVTAKTLNGDQIALPNQSFIAKDRDLALLPIQHEGKFLPPIESLTSDVEIGDYVTVFGNEAGAAVATSLTGKVNGIGPSTVEIDAKFVEGNSGSPVIHHKTGNVIGLATYYIEYEVPEADREGKNDYNRRQPNSPYNRYGRQKKPEEEEDDSGKKRRRFAERIDNVSEWEGVTFASLREEQKALDAYENYLNGVLQIAIGIIKEQRMIMPHEAYSKIENLLEDFHKFYDGRRQSNSEGNQRAFEELNRRLNNRLDYIKQQARSNLHTKYYVEQLDRLEAFDQKLRAYMDSL